MDYISLIFVLIFVIFMILGFAKGFIRTLLLFSKGLIAIILASLLCKAFANLLYNIPVFASQENGIISWLISKNTIFSETVYPSDSELIKQALSSLSIPSFISSSIANNVVKTIPESGMVLSKAIARSLMSLYLNGLSFIILVIIFRLILFILRKFINALFDSLPTIQKIDRIFGLAFGFFLGLCFTSLICFLFTGIISTNLIEPFATFLKNQMKLEQDTFTLSKFLYEHNFLMFLFSLI